MHALTLTAKTVPVVSGTPGDKSHSGSYNLLTDTAPGKGRGRRLPEELYEGRLRTEVREL